MPQVEDTEMKGWVVRSDAGPKPAWLKLDISTARQQPYAITGMEAIAHIFGDFDEAQRVADDWSDVPGVWRVDRK